ncbi:putative bifunctional diguanylate cyclase/phosphodiesterase [Cupriavidus basilensis]|uniref:putative bifunctional diguanylate cyclase/phosphodiesterase n=1 Tax=Cupriavidus basilensis TaxID=68895 RepID=UPI0020A66C17|nr:EAL domain-containing protein [Cupriavidus basilensis]MCP3023541.1 EAL domain-containing protein [Cupriavidus basilensis]
MDTLLVSECLDLTARRVALDQRYRDLVGVNQTSTNVFSVFDDSGTFLGVVTDRQATLFPGRIFADLIVRRPPEPVRENASAIQLLKRMRKDACEHLPVLDAQGRYIGIVSMASLLAEFVRRSDINRREREALVSQLRAELENRKISANVLESTSDAVLVMDARLRIQYVNRAFTAAMGYPGTDIVGRPAGFLRSGRHGRDFYAEIFATLRDGGRWEGEVWLLRADGSIAPDWVTIKTVHDEHGDVFSFVAMFADIMQRESLRAQYMHLAYYDSLTGLPNRRLFQDRLGHAIERSASKGTEFSLLFLDLNRFKDVNDTLGHSFGDRLLEVVGERFKRLVKEADFVGRIGGDEFTFILHDTADPEQVESIARRIFDELAKPIVLNGTQSYVSASIGVSRFPADGTTAEALIMNADAAMYRAKEDGIGTCHFFSRGLHTKVLKRLDISNALHRALEANEFSLAWQPQVSLTTGKVIGAEVLLRWMRDGSVPVSPAEFIPVAEETGVIGAIGDWVLRETCRYVAKLEALAIDPDFRVAVNFSPLQLSWHRQEPVLQTIAQFGVDCRRFKIELTENALFVHEEGLLEFVRELGAAGVGIAIDDFGTGYSNLSSLKHLPVTELKIDRAFVHDMQASHSDRQIVQAMIGMAHMLGLRVVAEGVEYAWQVSALREFGCEVGQGYLFSRPVDFDALVELLDAPAVDVQAMLADG